MDKDWPVVTERRPNACWSCFAPLDETNTDPYLTVWGGVICLACRDGGPHA